MLMTGGDDVRRLARASAAARARGYAIMIISILQAAKELRGEAVCVANEGMREKSLRP